MCVCACMRAGLCVFACVRVCVCVCVCKMKRLTNLSERCPPSISGPLSLSLSFSFSLLLHWDVVLVVNTWVLLVVNYLQVERKTEDRKPQTQRDKGERERVT